MKAKILFLINLLLTVSSVVAMFIFFATLVLSAFSDAAREIIQSNIFLLFALFIPLFLFYIFKIAMKVTGEDRDYLLYSWNFMRYLLLGIDEDFPLVDGETVVIPYAPCYIQLLSPISPFMPVRTMVRDVIITNKRILIGSVRFPVFGTEYFGTQNIWHPLLKEIPKVKTQIPLFNKLQMKKPYKISFETDKKFGDHVSAKADLLTVKIYHPESKRIDKLFSSLK